LIYKIFKIPIFAITVFIFTGCASVIGLGHEKSYCEEHEYDYSDAGFCGDPMLIYKHRKELPTGCGEGEK